MAVSMVSCRRLISTSVLTRPSLALSEAIAAAGWAMASFAPLANASRKALSASGFSAISLGLAMITLP
ncbi:hypothetical protein D3C85_1848670 [compost metagenome]